MSQPKKDFKKVYSEHRGLFFFANRVGRGEKKARGERWEGKIGELSKSTSGVERDLIQLTLFPFILFLKYQLRAQAEDKELA